MARRLVRMVVLFCGLSVLGLYACQRQMQYQPGHANPAPEALGLKGVQVETLETPDHVRLILWYAPPAPGKPTLLFFQGNAGDIADRAPRLAFYQSKRLGAAFLSYRGFGGSTGHISETGLIIDARTAYDWLRLTTPAAKITLVGESLGTGVAVQLAAQVPVAAVALDAPYASTLAIAEDRFPNLPVALLMKDQFLSINHVALINAPLLIQHGTADQVIPYASAQTLFAAAVEPKTFITLPGRGHEIIFAPDVWQREVDFFAHPKSNSVPRTGK
ncbi:MAG: alpha/beta hydrolase [Cypionkella sp.]